MIQRRLYELYFEYHMRRVLRTNDAVMAAHLWMATFLTLPPGE